MRVFADTSYFLALIDPGDEAHERAVRVSRTSFAEVVLTDFVIVELGAALSKTQDRGDFVALVRALSQPPYSIIPANTDWIRRGIELFESRPDKAWSLTDCISFLVMGELEITEALTTDHHFQQAGFHALLMT